MPTNPTANDNYISSAQFTIGPQNSIQIFETVSGNLVDWGMPTEINWESRPVTTRVPVNLMSGTKRDLIFEQGWSGSLSIQRTKSALDEYWSVLEAQVRAGVPRPTFTIQQRINESDGTITQLTFIQCQFTYDEAGTYANEEGVVQRMSFTSPARFVKKV